MAYKEDTKGVVIIRVSQDWDVGPVCSIRV